MGAGHVRKEQERIGDLSERGVFFVEKGKPLSGVRGRTGVRTIKSRETAA